MRGRSVATLLGVYAAVRIGLLVADVLSAHVGYAGDLDGPLLSWDSHLYLQIVTNGYPAVAPKVHGHLTYDVAAFEPLFPLLVRYLGIFGLSPVGAALVVSVVGGACTTLAVWCLGTDLVDEDVGWRAAAMFAVFPGMGVVWGLLYCECVGLALAAGSLLLMVRRRWLWAGLVGALATLTSPMALPLALAPLWSAAAQIRARRPPRALAATVLAPLGFLGYAAWIGNRYGDALFWWHLQRQAWGASIDFGSSLVRLLGHPLALGYQGPGWLELLGTAFVVGSVVALWRARLPGVINLYCAGVMVLLFASNSLGFKPRLLAWLFPVFVALAVAVRGRAAHVVITAFAVFLPIAFLAYSLLGNSMAQP